MKNHLLLIFSFILFQFSFAQNAPFPKELENSSLYEINKLPAHDNAFPFESMELAQKNNRNLSNNFISLDGKKNQRKDQLIFTK